MGIWLRLGMAYEHRPISLQTWVTRACSVAAWGEAGVLACGSRAPAGLSVRGAA